MSDTLSVVLVEQAGRTSHAYELFAAMPDSHLTVASNRGGWGTDREVVLRTWRPPFVDVHEAWTAAPAWLRGLPSTDFGRVDVVGSLEIFSFSSLQASQLARARGALHVSVVAETMAGNPLYRWPPWRTIARRLRGRIDAFLCITERAREHLLELGCPPERCHAIHLGIDADVFHPAPELEKRPVVTFVGMLRADRGADKGVLDIVEACRRVARDVPDLELRLVGDGHLRGQLEDIAARERFVRVLPPVPRNEIAALLRESRMLVLASKRTLKWEEQFGFVLVEAMASGLPVVATRSGAIPEVVAPGNDLVDEGDVAALAAAITNALGPGAAERGRRNREHVIQHYELQSQGRVLRALLDELVATDRASSR